MALVAVLGTVAAPVPAFAQGCSMCYSTAAAARASAIQALRSGILVLLIPPLLIFVGIFWMTWRSRERLADDDDPALGREFDEWLARQQLQDAVELSGRPSAAAPPRDSTAVPQALTDQTPDPAPQPTFLK